MKAIFTAVILLALGETTSEVVFTRFSEKTTPDAVSEGVTITGQLVDARTFQPLRGAIVSALRSPSDKPVASPNIGFRTAEDGRFSLRGVAPGIVNFYVAKAGYVPGPYPSVRPAASGERIDNVVLTVLPGASISGRVTEESGQPVAGVKVRIAGGQGDQSPTGVSNVSQFHQGLVTSSQYTVVTTDDDGTYWAGGLAPTRYEVTVIQEARAVIRTRDGDEIVIGSGGPIGDRSQPVSATLATGEDRTGVDLLARFTPTVSRSGGLRTETGTGSISGRVIDSLGRGVPSATVALLSPVEARGAISATTNSDGAFRIMELPDGTFALRVVRSDSVTWLNSPQTATVTVAGGSRVENVVLTLVRSAVISGTITDEFGDPVAADVTVIASSRTEGLQSGGIVTSDARGRYRIPLLRPGEYFLSAQPIAAGEVHFADYANQDRILARAPLFYPGVPKVTLASPLAVTEGAESAGVDFVLRPTASGTISVTLDAGRPVDDIQLRYVSLDDRTAAMNMTPVTGSTITLDLRPGRYRLVASADVPSGNDVIRLWSSTTVEPDTLVATSVNMTLEPGTNVSGRVIFEGSGPANPQGARPSLLPVGSGTRLGFTPGNSTFDTATGVFSIEGVLPGRYVIQAGERGAAWMLKSATLDGVDILDQPIDFNPGTDLEKVILTMTDRMSELSVTSTDAAVKSSREELAVVFSADQKHWYAGSRRMRVAPPNDKGTYIVRGLPAGTYLVALTRNSPSQDDSLPVTLQALAGSGVRVTLAEGEKKVLNVRR